MFFLFFLFEGSWSGAGCNDKMEPFQGSEHSHAEGNWRSPPKNPSMICFQFHPREGNHSGPIMFALFMQWEEGRGGGG